ncbi:MAG: alpha/beta fold hydrolase [Proteobacteria bacterium]|nr:alpha/beta fold hydrolase [Pseudomonadota bacterium]
MNTRKTNAPPRSLDQALHTRLARFTQGLSPAAIVGAYMDWGVHLAMSPDKQLALLTRAWRQAGRLAAQAAPSWRAEAPEGAPCIEPLPQDKRFSAREWQQWPFNLIYQAFLLNQQWWHHATTGVRGVTQHHEALATFYTRQLLDMVSPSNFAWSNPEVLAATVKSGGANLMQGALQWAGDAMRQAAGDPAAGTEHFRPGREVAITPGKVVLRNELIELIQYAPQTKTVFAEPLLLVPSWIMKYYILDLSPANSLVKYLVEAGHTVFVVSWKNPDAADRDIGMDDYLQSGVMAALDAVTAITAKTAKKKIHALGYCLGGTLMAIAAARMARDDDPRLASLTLLASELDFSEPGELGLFIDESQLAFLDDMMAERGYLDGKQMAGAFALLNSRDLVFSRSVRDYLLGRPQEVNDLGAWNADATRMPYRQHSEYLRGLYLDNDLAEGRFRSGGKPVALSDIRVPMFVLGTQRDTVSPWRSVYKVHMLTDTEVSFCLTSGGHNVGVVNPPGADGGSGPARSWQLATRDADGKYVDPDSWLAATPTHTGSWWPAWLDWLNGRSGRRVVPPAMGHAAAGYAAIDDAPGRYVSVA